MPEDEFGIYVLTNEEEKRQLKGKLELKGEREPDYLADSYEEARKKSEKIEETTTITAVNNETAPEHVICEECNFVIRTHDEDWVEAMRTEHGINSEFMETNCNK